MASPGKPRAGEAQEEEGWEQGRTPGSPAAMLEQAQELFLLCDKVQKGTQPEGGLDPGAGGEGQG